MHSIHTNRNQNIYNLIGYWKDLPHFKDNKELFIEVFEYLSTDLASIANTQNLLDCYRVLHLEYQSVMNGNCPFRNHMTVKKISDLLLFGITIHPSGI